MSYEILYAAVPWDSLTESSNPVDLETIIMTKTLSFAEFVCRELRTQYDILGDTAEWWVGIVKLYPPYPHDTMAFSSPVGDITVAENIVCILDPVTVSRVAELPLDESKLAQELQAHDFSVSFTITACRQLVDFFKRTAQDSTLGIIGARI